MSDIAVVTLNQVPRQPATYKYEWLGELALLNHRIYCERHGYDFIAAAQIEPGRPACWAKIPAVLTALETHDWVLWADSDTLFADMESPLERFCDPAFDLIVQLQEFWWKLIGLADGDERFPVNSGVFLMRSTPWAKGFLKEAYQQAQFVTGGEVWDGIGDQEAMNHLIRSNPDYRRRIGYKDGLQISPRLYEDGYLLIHFYGDRAHHYLSTTECERVFQRWEQAVRLGEALPDDLLRFHWCCIQVKDPQIHARGELDHYMYRLEEICHQS